MDQMSDQDAKRRAESIRTLENVSGNPKLSIHDKAKFAETLREVSDSKLKYKPRLTSCFYFRLNMSG